jgi:hypothetical protein
MIVASSPLLLCSYKGFHFSRGVVIVVFNVVHV